MSSGGYCPLPFWTRTHVHTDDEHRARSRFLALRSVTLLLPSAAPEAPSGLGLCSLGRAASL
ncbi:hypothetical protein M885DRAFT_513267 [Pelagophyceae sp. CCMP2097]|nr:hypothetical protein M885DRAFT_513267 [Pelagophyceae sp. CCMP2097]